MFCLINRSVLDISVGIYFFVDYWSPCHLKRLLSGFFEECLCVRCLSLNKIVCVYKSTMYTLLLLLVRLHDQASSSDEVGGLLQVLQAPILFLMKRSC